MQIKRKITQHLINLSKQFRAIAVLGPYGSGKTTLVKETFPDYAYVTLEDLDTKISATSSHFFDGLMDWQKISKQENITPYVVYGGFDSIKREKGYVFSWKDIIDMLNMIYK